MAASEDGGVSDRESSSEMEGRGNLRSCSDQGTPSSVPLKPSGDRFFPDVKFCAACGLGSSWASQQTCTACGSASWNCADVSDAPAGGAQSRSLKHLPGSAETSALLSSLPSKMKRSREDRDEAEQRRDGGRARQEDRPILTLPTRPTWDSLSAEARRICDDAMALFDEEEPGVKQISQARAAGFHRVAFEIYH